MNAGAGGMQRRWVIRRAVIIIGLLAGPALTPQAVPPAWAASEPGVTATPNDGLVDGQVIAVEVSGLSGEVAIMQCAAEVVWRDAEGAITLVEAGHCRGLGRTVTVAPGDTVTVEMTVLQDYTTSDRYGERPTYCGGVGADCLIVAQEVNPSRPGGVAATPIHFGPPHAEPSVTVTPSTGLRVNDTAEVQLTGFGRDRQVTVAQCPRSVLDDLDDIDRILFQAICQYNISTDAGSSPPVDPATGELTVAEAWAWDSGGWPDSPPGIEATHCGPTAGGCVVVAYGRETDTFAFAPITIEPSPLAVAPTEQEAGFPVRAFAAGDPGSTMTIAQCAAPLGDGFEASTCGPAIETVLDDTGDAGVTVELVEEVTGPAGSVPCPESECVLALFGPDGAAISSVPVRVHAADGPPVVSFDDGEVLHQGGGVTWRATGTRNEFIRYAQCDSVVTVAGRLDQELCTEILPSWNGYEYGESTGGFIVERHLSIGDGTQIDCSVPGTCVVAVETSAGHLGVAPYTVATAPALVVMPDRDLVEGQPFTATATGLLPGATYYAVRCVALVDGSPACEWADRFSSPVVATADGNGTFQLTAAHRFTVPNGGPSVYCRDQCQLGLARRNAAPDPDTLVPFTMSHGTISASPAEGLIDGQEVTITGEGLHRTYGGGPWWIFEAGEWALGQCSRSVLDNPTVYGVFSYCAAPPGGGVVHVQGSELSVTISAQASLDPPVGDPVDCTAEERACTVILTRIEDDGTLTVVSTPLGFATPT